MSKDNGSTPSAITLESQDDVENYFINLDRPLLSPTSSPSDVPVISLDRPAGYADVSLDPGRRLRSEPYDIKKAGKRRGKKGGEETLSQLFDEIFAD